MKLCKCTHPATTHLGGTGVCTAIGCACDGFVAAVRTVSVEAQNLATAFCTGSMSQAAIAAAVQELVEARTSWEREAQKLLAQRDYAELRANQLEERMANAVDALKTLAARLEVKS
jgi:FtsZ-binding cell division protein ZapB